MAHEFRAGVDWFAGIAASNSCHPIPTYRRDWCRPDCTSNPPNRTTCAVGGVVSHGVASTPQGGRFAEISVSKLDPSQIQVSLR